MMFLTRAITQHFSTSTKNHLRTSSNTHNQAYVQDGRVDVQTKNVGNVGIARRNMSCNVGSLQTTAYCYNCKEKGYYARECPTPKVRDSNYFKQLLAKQDKAGIHLDEEQNDFLLADIKERNTSCIMMAHIQIVANESDAEPSYDLDFVDKIQDPSSSFLEGLISKNNHEQSYHEQ
ncbi:integrase, catalytic region, zinc finger, CCHC-type containing protein [Tanacetum coccineum]|uniref:Integrase, catalytic region, zinc finger, CCHC-type containing protein n=1 Tax=Tanacetum coccineum TaxID=301880 RepID=A0ABQ5IM87_9ASTR